jgi:hypothetical protein
MSMPQEIEHIERRGRKLGGKNKPGHHAGRPRKEPEKFHESIWEHGKAEISVLEKHFTEALAKNSSHCAIAFAIRDAVPSARRISVDLQTIRWTDTKKGVRFVFLTPSLAQTEVIIPFDQGEECKPVTFRMRPAWVVRAGARYQRHTPEPDQLKGTGLKVAEEQPHIGADNSPNGSDEDCAPDRKLIPYAGKEQPKPRQRRTMISATKPDGTIPVTLGGKLPPRSVLARREYGMRVLKK